MKIQLFTLKYPYGNGEQFLHEEVNFLSKKEGVEIELIPFEISDQIPRIVPNRVKINPTLAQEIKNKSETKLYPLLQNGVAILKAVFKHKIRNLSGLRDTIGFAHHGNIVKKWAMKNVNKEDLLYTYWFERITYGLALFKATAHNDACLISRAHGYDVYAFRREHNFIPFRIDTLNLLNRVFVVSSNGKEYLIKNYGFEDKIDVGFLGIKNYEITDNVKGSTIRIVSCSSIINLKRVDLIAKVIKSFCSKNEHLSVHWDHFGDGDRTLVNDELQVSNPNLSYTLHGDVSNDTLLSFYSTHYIDVFVNFSETEGLPMSMMEAASFQIPILATEVGGVSEIVSVENGVLLAPEFEIKDALEGLNSILLNKELRVASRKIFEEKFDAKKNYQSFYASLKNLMNEK